VAARRPALKQSSGRPPRAVVLPRAVRRAIITHARQSLPVECCGLLVGRGRHVSGALPIDNRARSAVRYELDPRAHIDARRVLRQLMPPLEILGVYHSHPAGSARPSASDIDEAAYGEWVYLIVGLKGGRASLAAFRINTGRARPVRLDLPAAPGR
jgi:proteasome lid subunit RPN8/RPN11